MLTGTVRYLLVLSFIHITTCVTTLPFQPVTQSSNSETTVPKRLFCVCTSPSRGPVIIQTARNVFPTSIPAHRSTAAQITLFSFRAGEQPTYSSKIFLLGSTAPFGDPFVDLTPSNVSALAFAGIDRATAVEGDTANRSLRRNRGLRNGPNMGVVAQDGHSDDRGGYQSGLNTLISKLLAGAPAAAPITLRVQKTSTNINVNRRHHERHGEGGGFGTRKGAKCHSNRT